MTIPLARTVRKLKEAVSRRLPQRRDDSGLTTLEWLLIVAAVAGLAALAVVLVQNVVSDTSEQIAGNSARMTSARVQADDIDQQYGRSTTEPTPTTKQNVVDAKYASKCRRINISYAATFEAAEPPQEAEWEKPETFGPLGMTGVPHHDVDDERRRPRPLTISGRVLLGLVELALVGLWRSSVGGLGRARSVVCCRAVALLRGGGEGGVWRTGRGTIGYEVRDCL